MKGGGGGGGGGENMKLSPSFTTLSTIAIQAGQSQLVVSVLRSGSLVHLQLVQVHPGLCEIGWNQEENQKLIQEQQQLIHKLQKHESEALSLVKSSRQTEQRRDEGMMELKEEEEEAELKKEEEEAELKEAMGASLSEGWSLLLHLLHRRQEVLMMASDFYHRALEFDVSINKLENLQVRTDDVRLTEVQLRFDSMRKDVLLKSLQVLNSCNVLLHKLRQLQSTEALQRRGVVLQDWQVAGGCEEESSQSSQEVALRLEELVEKLQDRRRRADQAVRLQLQQVEKSIVVQKEESGSDDWTLILDQNLESESTPAEGAQLQSHSRTEETRELQTGSRSVLRPGSNSEETSNFESDHKPRVELVVRSGSRFAQTRDLEPESRSDIQSGSRSDPMSRFRSEPNTGPRLEEIRNLQSRFRLNLTTGSRSDMKSDSKSAAIRNLQPESRLVQMIGSRSEPTRDLESGFRSEETRKLESGFRSELTSRSRLEGDKDLQSESGSEETVELHLGSRSDIKCESRSDLRPGSRSDKTGNLHTRSRSDLQENSRSVETRNIESLSTLDVDPRSRLDLKTESRSETKDLLNVVLRSRLEKDTEYRSILVDHKDPQSGSRSNEEAGSGSNIKPESRSDQKHRIKLDMKSGATSEQTRDLKSEAGSDIRSGSISNLQDGFRSEPQCASRPDDFPSEETRTIESGSRSEKPGSGSGASGSRLDLNPVASMVQRTIKQLNRTKQEVNELRSRHQVQIHQQEEEVTSHRKYREKLLKTLQDLRSVSELLDSCTDVDLGSDPQTATLTERFIQATPLFTQLDAEVEEVKRSWKGQGGDQVEQVKRSWEGMGGDQEVEQVKRSWEGQGGDQEVEEDEVSELLTLQKKVKEKMEQSEWILDLSSSFHLRAQQLEALLLSDSAGSHEKQQLIKSLFTTAAALKTNICTAAAQCDWAGFKLQQLELRLLSLDSLCVSWLNEAARREEEELHRERVTRQINDDITQLRDSFKELKKRFNNLKVNFLKRNDRTRNMKAVRNQLQQVEQYEDKLQSLLRKRLQGVRAQLGSEGVARELEDAVNELQRQMGEFGRSVSEHQKTLDMTCRLQQAMEEYQFWCEEASATITRVQTFSSDCRSTEAVNVLHRQFEKFVWPTVPQQEERIGQISDLAVKLHGVEEGRRYMERTLTKHSEMVASIRDLSDGLMELEAKLKLKQMKPEKQQKNNGEKEIKEDEKERTRLNETEEEETEKKSREKRKIKRKEQVDNCRSQEAADVCELKETGHTPELTSEHDGKEVPVKKQTAANRKPPLQKSDNQEADRQTVTTEISHREQSDSSSFCSTHTFSLCCSPVEAGRQVSAILSQLQPISTEAQTTSPHPVIGPSLSDVQRECHRKEVQDASDLSEAELHQQEVMSEDSLSNDEYECVSPDDISLPPLAETPESGLVQSDFEEGLCFSSHSAHVNQHSHHYHAQSEQSGTGVVRQQRGSSQTEGCPTPPTNHSNSRFRSESSSFVQSPFPVPAPGFLTIMQTEETSVDFLPGSTDAHFISRSNQSHESKTTDADVPERRSPSETEPLLNDLNSQLNRPQQCTGAKSNGNQNVTSKSKTLPQTDHIVHPAELDQSPALQSSYCPQPFNGPDTDINKDKTRPQDTGFLECRTFPQITTICQENRFTQSFPNSGIGFNQDTNSSQTRKETYLVSKPQSNSLTCTSTVTEQNVYLKFSPSDTFPQARSNKSSPHKSSVSQNKTLLKNNPIPRTRGFAQSSDRTLPADIRTCSQTSTSLLQHNNPPQSFPDSMSGLDQSKPSTQPSKETSSVKKPQTTTTTVTQQTVYCQSSSSDRQCNVPQAGITLGSRQDLLPDVHVPNIPEPDRVNNIPISSSNRLSNKQSQRTVYCVHESLTQCVHDPGVRPGSAAESTAPPQPQTRAQQANPHVTPPSSPSHLLTSDQDPDICQPMAIREEIRLTPQIQGPPLPAPSLFQAQACKPGPPCFTRPLSRATVKEGSPVMLEVEVTGHPEPTLTWSEDGDASPGRALLYDDRRHFLFLPDVSDAVKPPASQPTADDKWLVAEVFELISADWQTWFGTLCALLWLLYLILL